jgi:hypothetical protein
VTGIAVGAPNGSPETPPDAALSLRVFPEDGALVWEATNEGTDGVRLWQQGNSWGWPMPRLYLDPEPDSTAPHRLTPAARVWTRNFPASVDLAPQESARYVLRAGDFDPEMLDAVQGLWHEPLRVRGELRCEPSPEAVEHGVWCGTLRGEEQELSPPHAWLDPASEP